MKNKIVICGATGNQGGAVARALLKTGQWKVTALTRDPASARACALAASGADVVKADLLDINSLLRAFEGAYGVFGLTQPWAYEQGRFDPAAGIMQGKNIIWACRQAGVRLPVLSTILNLCGQRSGVSYIDTKAVLEELFRSHIGSGIIVRPALYLENIGSRLLRVSGNRISGRFGEDHQIPYLALQDLGRLSVRIFERGEELCGTTLNLASEVCSGRELASVLSQAGSQRYVYTPENRLLQKIFKPQQYAMRRYFEQQADFLASDGRTFGDLFYLPFPRVSRLAFLESLTGILLSL